MLAALPMGLGPRDQNIDVTCLQTSSSQRASLAECPGLSG